MKHFYAFAILLLSLTLSAQPAGYYDSAIGTGYTLKTNLFNIINNNTNSSSTANYGDLWILYDQTAFEDHYYDNDGTIVDLYTEKPTETDTYTFTPISDQCGNYSNEGDCYNREHVIPKSYFGGDNSYPMYSDAFMVFPSDGYVNGKHDNFPYGMVNSASYTSSNNSKLGSALNSGYSAGYSGIVFEPIDEFKGDVARAYFYFVTRYQDQLINFYNNYSSSGVSAMFDGTTYPAFSTTFLNILLTWNNLDPVSQMELDKNDAIYVFQGNRNPFIDDLTYVTKIWGSPLSISVFTNSNFKIYPNPLKGNYLNIETSKDLNVEIFDIIGKQVFKSKVTSNSNRINVGALNKGIYIVRLISEDGQVTRKLIKQ